MVRRGDGEPVHGGFANAPGRIVDHPLEAFVVGRIGREAEVGNQVLDLLALVETEAPVDAVGDVALAQLLLEGTGLGVGPVEDGEVLMAGLLPRPGGEDAIGDVAALVVVAQGPVHVNLVAVRVAGPHLLADLVLVLGDDRVGRLDDGLRAPVVLLELIDHTVRVVPLEVEDVLDVGPAEAVDALGVVADHADVFPGGTELPDDEVLGEVGILILVDQDEGELLLVLVEQVGEVPEEDVGLEEQVVEVHRPGALETEVVSGIDLRDARPARLLVLPHDVRVGRIVLRTDEVVLGAGDAAVDRVGLVELVVEAEALDHILDDAPAVLRVIDGEVGGVIDPLALDPEDAGKDGVEGAHPDVARLGLAYNLADAALHLARGLVGEREGEDGERIDALVDEVGDAVGEDTRLAGTGSGDHHHGAFDVAGGGPLCVVQSLEHLHVSKVAGLGSSTLGGVHRMRWNHLHISMLEFPAFHVVLHPR